MTFYIKRNDTSPSLLGTLEDGAGAAVNVNGATVRFHLRSFGAQAIKVDAAAVVVSGLTGVVRYDWQPGDTDTIGSYQAEFEVTYADGTIETFPNDGYTRVEIVGDIA